MDIAKIRKKALEKDQKGNESSACPPGNGNAVDPDQALEKSAAHHPSGGISKEDDVSSKTVDEGLDRLFSMPENQMFAAHQTGLVERSESFFGLEAQLRQYLSFFLHKEEYALDIAQISEIIKVRETTTIPRSPDYVLGIISLRGVVVPVFDLRLRLNLEAAAITRDSRIVVCRSQDRTVGLVVDSIYQVVKVNGQEIEEPPRHLTEFERDMLLGLGRYQGRMIILLKLDKLVEVDFV
jgi:purine-binding chemotaxis protein CheW